MGVRSGRTKSDKGQKGRTKSDKDNDNKWQWGWLGPYKVTKANRSAMKKLMQKAAKKKAVKSETEDQRSKRMEKEDSKVRGYGGGGRVKK
jgi:phage terminase small subunit